MDRPALIDAPAQLSIAEVEREVGLAKDTLRVWERRYGFPRPLRDALGERLYPAEQVDRLRMIKRLMDQGLRPSAVVPAEPDQLRERLVASQPESTAEADWVIRLLQRHAVEGLRLELSQRLAREGLAQFVCETLPGLNLRVGEAWAAGEIRVFEEHLYSDVLEGLLRATCHTLPRASQRPKVLLATVRGEEHRLGLLMVESLLLLSGAACISLGTQNPLPDIAAAALRLDVDVVALSFSRAYPVRRAREALGTLRSSLPESIVIWAGGGLLAQGGGAIPGTRLFAHIRDLLPALADWQAS